MPERQWREQCSTRRLSPTDTAEAQRKAFDRAFKALLEKRVVAARGGLVWIARHPADGHGQKTDTSEPVRAGNPGGATDTDTPLRGVRVRPAQPEPRARSERTERALNEPFLDGPCACWGGGWTERRIGKHR